MNYHTYGLTFTQGQAHKLQKAVKNGCPVSIRLLYANLAGNDKMLLTQRQIQKIVKLVKSGKGGMVLELSLKQLKQNMQKEGGFLWMLAGLAMRALPMLAKTVLPALSVGALRGVGSAAMSKAVGSGLYFKGRGNVCFGKKTRLRIYITPGQLPKTYRDGLNLIL